MSFHTFELLNEQINKTSEITDSVFGLGLWTFEYDEFRGVV